MTKEFIAMLLAICFNIAANAFLKQGAVQAHASSTWLNTSTILGAMSFACAFLAYVFALRTLPLYLAQSMTVIQFIGGIFVSRWFFMEKIGFWEWSGILCISLGLLMIGLASTSSSH